MFRSRLIRWGALAAMALASVPVFAKSIAPRRNADVWAPSSAQPKPAAVRLGLAPTTRPVSKAQPVRATAPAKTVAVSKNVSAKPVKSATTAKKPLLGTPLARKPAAKPAPAKSTLAKPKAKSIATTKLSKRPNAPASKRPEKSSASKASLTGQTPVNARIPDDVTSASPAPKPDAPKAEKPAQRHRLVY